MPREIHFKRVRCKPVKKPKLDKVILFILLGIFFFFLLIFFFNNTNTGNIGQIISEQKNLTAEIRFVIEIDKAEHLDSERQFIFDIYEEVKELDNVWSNDIGTEEYIRITFEEELTSESDITIYPRIVSGTPKIEVYEVDSNGVIAEFTEIDSNQYNRVLLTNLVGEQDSFDLRILDGSIEIEHIIDPSRSLKNERYQ